MIDIPDLEADAIRYRLMLRNEAQATLDATIRQVQTRLNVDYRAQIQIDDTGRMAFVDMAPPE
jgi:hypothetical protein